MTALIPAGFLSSAEKLEQIRPAEFVGANLQSSWLLLYLYHASFKLAMIGAPLY